MSIVAKLKRYVPKTPKQWVIAGLGTSAAALGVDYVWRKDASIVGGLLHRLHGGGGGGGGRVHAAHPHAPPHAQPQFVQPMVMPQMPPMVYVEPAMASSFNYRFRHHGSEHYAHHGHHPHHDPYAATMHAYDRVHDMHPHHFQHEHHHEAQMAQPLVPPSHPSHPHHQQQHDPKTWAYEGGTTNPYDPAAQHPHIAGVAAGPHPPEQSRARVPAPGALGVVQSHTPQAAGVVMGDFSPYGWEG